MCICVFRSRPAHRPTIMQSGAVHVPSLRTGTHAPHVHTPAVASERWPLCRARAQIRMLVGGSGSHCGTFRRDRTAEDDGHRSKPNRTTAAMRPAMLSLLTRSAGRATTARAGFAQSGCRGRVARTCASASACGCAAPRPQHRMPVRACSSEWYDCARRRGAAAHHQDDFVGRALGKLAVALLRELGRQVAGRIRRAVPDVERHPIREVLVVVAAAHAAPSCTQRH